MLIFYDANYYVTKPKKKSFKTLNTLDIDCLNRLQYHNCESYIYSFSVDCTSKIKDNLFLFKKSIEDTGERTFVDEFVDIDNRNSHMLRISSKCISEKIVFSFLRNNKIKFPERLFRS